MEAVVAAACECCGFTQECTAAYMAAVRARHGGRWICGLCGDAVGEELALSRRRHRRRSCGDRPIVSSEREALDRQASFCRAARRPPAPPSSSSAAEGDDLIAAVSVLLLRRLGSPSSSPRSSTPNTPSRRSLDGAAAAGEPADSDVSAGVALARNGSCFAALLDSWNDKKDTN